MSDEELGKIVRELFEYMDSLYRPDDPPVLSMTYIADGESTIESVAQVFITIKEGIQEQRKRELN